MRVENDFFDSPGALGRVVKDPMLSGIYGLGGAIAASVFFSPFVGLFIALLAVKDVGYCWREDQKEDGKLITKILGPAEVTVEVEAHESDEDDEDETPSSTPGTPGTPDTPGSVGIFGGVDGEDDAVEVDGKGDEAPRGLSVFNASDIADTDTLSAPSASGPIRLAEEEEAEKQLRVLSLGMADPLQPVMVVGSPGSGKGVTVSSMLSLGVMERGAEVWVVDPKSDAQEAGLWKRVARHYLLDPSINWDLGARVLGILSEFEGRMRARKNGKERRDTPLILFLDELNTIAMNLTKEETPVFGAKLITIAAQGRSQNCSIWIAAQAVILKQLGIEGATNRDMFSQVVCINGANKSKARSILLTLGIDGSRLNRLDNGYYWLTTEEIMRAPHLEVNGGIWGGNVIDLRPAERGEVFGGADTDVVEEPLEDRDSEEFEIAEEGAILGVDEATWNKESLDSETFNGGDGSEEVIDFEELFSSFEPSKEEVGFAYTASVAVRVKEVIDGGGRMGVGMRELTRSLSVKQRESLAAALEYLTGELDYELSGGKYRKKGSPKYWSPSKPVEFMQRNGSVN
jgi:hypothetical protein